MTLLAFSFCDLEWWHGLLAWLLPFLLGLLLGYAIWAKYKRMKEELEGDIRGLKKKITGLESDLHDCRNARTELDSEVSMLRGQLRERDLKISTLEASLEAAKKAKDTGGKGASAIAGIAAAAGLAPKKKSKRDKLQKIEGIGPKIEGLLNKDDINSFGDLADTKVPKLRSILDAGGPKFKIAKPDTWPEQAALARDGKWDELEKLQDILIGGVRPDPSAVAAGGKDNKDDLKKIEGIGPKIEGLLNDDGIWTFGELASSAVSRIKKILDDAGPRYRIAVPDTWPEQSALARDGKWDELEKLQDSLKGGRKA